MSAIGFELPEQRPEGDDVVFRWRGRGVQMRFGSFVRQRDGHTAVMDVVTIDPDTAEPTGAIGLMRVGLLSPTSQRDAVKALTEADNLRLDWQRAVVHCFRQAYKAATTPAGSVVLRDVPDAPVRHLLAYRGAGADAGLVPEGEATLYQGDGGSLKSYLALAAALALELGEPVGPFAPSRRGNALYLDWETRDETARHRMGRLCAALGVPAPALRYLRCEAPLVDCLEHVRREVDRHAIDLVVVDSVALAVGGEVTAENVLPFQAGLRRLGAGVGKLLVSHVSLESVKGKGVARAYGSVFVRNLARRAWEVKRTAREGPGRYVVALTCEKTNDSDEADEPLGVRVAFADPDGPVRVAAVSADDVPSIAERMTHAARALRLLRHGPLTTDEVAAELGLTDNAARSVLGRLKTEQRVAPLDMPSAAGARRRAWGLAAPLDLNGREPH